MAKETNWAFPAEMRPRPEDWRFDLDGALDAVVQLRAEIPEDAFTAPILGTERVGNGDEPGFGNAAREIARVHAAEAAEANDAYVQSFHRLVTISSFTMMSGGSFSPARIFTALSTAALPMS